MKFLIVDDDPIILGLLTEILIGFGYENIERARGGHEALALASSSATPFNCMMLDIQMPEMDGIELCRSIRALPQYANVPIIMITVMRDFDHVIRAFAAGATDYTVKPFEVRDLIDRVKIAEVIKNPEQARLLSLTRTRNHQISANADNLISRAALESYVRNCRIHKLISPVALSLRISPFEDSKVSEAAQAITSVYQRDGVFQTYLGDGQFVIVCDRFSKVPEETFEERLSEALMKISVAGPEHKLRIGSWMGPLPFEKFNDTAFLHRAIVDCREGWWKRKTVISPLVRRLGNIQ